MLFHNLWRAVLAAGMTASLAAGAPVRLRTDYRDNPIGIDSAAPSLSWQSDNTERGWRQSAYQILVASSPAGLAKPDVWDSGKVPAGDSVDVPYAGPTLESRKRYYWTVRVWDAAGKMTRAAAPAWWEMGLLSPGDWRGKWIERPDPEQAADRAVIRWIWLSGQDAFAVPGNTAATFRVEWNQGAPPRNAALFLVARADWQATINGKPAGSKEARFQAFDRQDITEHVVAGRNVLEVTLKTAAQRGPGGGAPAPRATALAGMLKLIRADGSVERLPSGAAWQGRAEAGEWKPAAEVASLGDARMGPDPGPLPASATLLRRGFEAPKAVRSVRLYITALGSYRAFLNGRPIGAGVLTPEYTDYRKRVTYQTYDVTPLVARGPNVLAAMLGDGWFGSAMTWTGVSFMFLPPPPRLLAQLHINYADGSRDTLVTDESWKAAPAPILHSEIYAGEVYDARLEQPGWDRPGFRDAGWGNAAAGAPPAGALLSAQVTEPARIVETLTPRAITRAPGGAYIADMGQNMVGWLRLKATGPAGTKIRLRFAEILNPDGSLYVANLRGANQTDAYFLRGGGEETWAPLFTFHGFRYVEISGYPGTLTADKLVGEVTSSMQQVTGRLTTSSELVNQMWRTGIWGQRGNFLSVPTDCPQRDERLGWTGDAQVFWRTGSYNADIAAFGRKWMRDVVDGQSEEGAFGNTAPNMPDSGVGAMRYGAPGWGDAGVIVPWTAWQQYGDLGIIREHWPAMERWMKFIEEANPNYLRRNKTGANFADWLPAGSTTPRDLVATAYWALIAPLMSQMADALGKPAEAKRYTQTYENVRAAFQKEFIKPDGTIGSGSQTSYVLALHARLVPPELRQNVVDRLVKDIEQHNWHLTTGFLGTSPLLFVLSDHGRADVAYRLLLNETYPSWGYMIRKGATTWWERWNSDTGDPAMNSFNHYAFGSVVAWVYRYAAGIDTAPAAPGFKEIVIRPRLGGGLTAARGEYDSVYGKIISDWKGAAQGPFTLRVTIPPNTAAKVYLPAYPNARLSEGGKPLTAPVEGGSFIVTTGAGQYEFRVE
jgi:alpha-L-rhamnosidase